MRWHETGFRRHSASAVNAHSSRAFSSAKPAVGFLRAIGISARRACPNLRRAGHRIVVRSPV